MPPKTNRRKNTQGSNNNGTRLVLKINKEVTPGAATTTVQKLMSLDGSTATVSLSAISSIVAAYMDMYRYFKINRLSVRIFTDTVSSTTTKIYPLVLAHLAPGNTAEPTDQESFETPNQTITYMDPAHNVPLVLGSRAFKSISDWFVTQNDASSEVLYSAGEIWIATSSSIAPWGASSKFTLFIDLDISFRTLLDPGLISTLMKNLSTRAESPPARIDGIESTKICADSCPCPHCQKP